MKNHILKDIKGNTVYVSDKEIMDKVFNSNTFQIFGMGRFHIKALRKEYLKRGGPLPITVDRIEMVFHEPQKAAKPFKEDSRFPVETVNGEEPWSSCLPKGVLKEAFIPDNRVKIDSITVAKEPAPDQYPQSRRYIDKVRKTPAFLPRELTVSEKAGFNEIVQAAVAMEGAEGTVRDMAAYRGMEKALPTKETYRVTRQPPFYVGWANPQFISSQSLDGKNVEIKKKKELPDYYMKRLLLERALEHAKIDMAYHTKEVKLLNADKTMNIFMRLSRIGISIARFAEISNRMSPINGKINQLDKE